MCDSIGSGEERAVQPAAALADKLGERLRHIGLRDRALDILQYPEMHSLDMYGNQESAETAYQLEFAFATSSKHRMRCGQVSVHVSCRYDYSANVHPQRGLVVHT